MALVVYGGSTLVMAFGAHEGWLWGRHLLGWLAFVVPTQLAVYLALRNGWSERLPDRALTSLQILLGIVAVEWGYLFCGPVRSVCLYPLLLIFVFGAFSLSWRRIAGLTVFALLGLVACVIVLNAGRPATDRWSLSNPELRLDVMSVLAIVIVLPALSMVAARLSALRRKLLAQRRALAQALEQVERLATLDELTGLPNRRYMQRRLAQELCLRKREGAVFSLAVIDVDHFKDINDAHGHAGGDDVLRAFAQAAQSTLRECDLMARWGGEEFLLLLPSTGAVQAEASLSRLAEHVRGLPLGLDAPLTFSAGVTEHRKGEELAETIARADRAMYEAKQAGRDNVRRN